MAPPGARKRTVTDPWETLAAPPPAPMGSTATVGYQGVGRSDEMRLQDRIDAGELPAGATLDDLDEIEGKPRRSGARPAPVKESAPQAAPGGSTTAAPETRINYEDGTWETTDRATAERLAEAFPEAVPRNRHLRGDPSTWPALRLNPETPIPPDPRTGKSIPEDIQLKLAGEAPVPPAALPDLQETDEERRTPPPRPLNYEDAFDPQNFADKVTKVNPETGRHDYLGHNKHELAYDYEDRVQRAANEYGRDDPVPSSRNQWEDALAGSRDRITDQDIWRSYMGERMFGDGSGAALKLRELMRREQGSYDEQMGKARDRDYDESMRDSRVSRGMAQFIAATTGIKPEDAAHLKMGDPLVKAVLNGGYSVGTRFRQQDLTSGSMQQALMNAAWMKLFGESEENKRLDKTLEQRDKESQLKAQAETAPLPALTVDQRTSWYHNHKDIPIKIARGIAEGTVDPATLPKGMQNRIAAADADLAAATSLESRTRLLEGATKGETRNRDANTVRSNDPKLNIDQWDKFNAVKQPFDHAYDAMVDLAKVGKLSVLTKLGTEGWEKAFRDLSQKGGEQAKAGAIAELMQAYSKGNFGLTLTENEKQSLMDITGYKYGKGATAWFTSEAKIVGFLNRMQKILAKREALLRKNLGQGNLGEE